jgi:hypothetical protein
MMLYPRAQLGLLLELAARIVEVRPVGTGHEMIARDLLNGFVEACLNAGQDILVDTLDTDEPALNARLVGQLAANYDERGPRNTKSRVLVDCLLAALGVTLGDDPRPPISLGDDVRRDVVAAITAVLDVELAPAQLRERIIATARAACEPAHLGTFDKIAAQLDNRGLTLLKQPKVPLDASQAIQRHLTAARETVIGGAARAAIDRAKPAIEKADAIAGKRIDTPITLKLTPRDVAVRRILEHRVPKTPNVVVTALVEALASVAVLTWRVAVRNARTYSARETFAVGELVEHPKFGLGNVTSVATQRIEVEFSDGTRALVHAKT